MTDLRQTKKYSDYITNLGWKVEHVDNINYFIRPFPFFGSFMKVQRPEKIDMQVIEKLQNKHRVFQTIIEPVSISHQPLVISHGYKVASPYLPSKTICIDLKKSELELLKDMHHKTRYNIRLAEKKDIQILESTNIHVFAKLWKDAKFTRKMMGTIDIEEIYKAFGKDAHLLLAYKDSELLGGVLAIHAAKVAYYMYAATTEKGRKLFAPTLLTWEQIKLAKKSRCTIFDFEGIYDERFPLKDWKGFSRFKKGFGGIEVEYPGAFSKVKLF